jgi:FkbM family methyltransferase
LEAIHRIGGFVLSRAPLQRVSNLLLNIALRGVGVGYSSSARNERLFLRSLALQRGAVVLDVGANRGQYARLVKAAHPEATVFSFEPHPASFADLARVADELGITAINAACGAVEGSTTLFDYADGGGTEHASVVPGVIEAHGGDAERHEVRMLALDAFCAARQIHAIDLLKIDVEGHELAVIEGASRLIARGAVPLIQFEFNEMNLRARVFLDDFRRALPGYRFYRLLGDGSLYPLDGKAAVFSEIFAYQNIVAKLAPS